jgi:hypothetical protein
MRWRLGLPGELSGCAWEIARAQQHLGRGFARECDREDFLGIVDDAQQFEVTLDQEFGLARTGRRLHDERARHVEGVAAGRDVGLEKRRVSCHGAAPCSD